MTPRTCTACGAPMREGYCVDDGAEYYCSDTCLHENYLSFEWERMHEEGEGYWTTWPNEDA